MSLVIRSCDGLGRVAYKTPRGSPPRTATLGHQKATQAPFAAGLSLRSLMLIHSFKETVNNLAYELNLGLLWTSL